MGMNPSERKTENQLQKREVVGNEFQFSYSNSIK